MGCGCRGGSRPSTRQALGPMSTRNNTARLRAVEKASNNEQVQSIFGMTKQQRDAERKKRIQAIIAKRKGQ